MRQREFLRSFLDLVLDLVGPNLGVEPADVDLFSHEVHQPQNLITFELARVQLLFHAVVKRRLQQFLVDKEGIEGLFDRAV